MTNLGCGVRPAALETLIGGIESISCRHWFYLENKHIDTADPLVNAIYANIGTTEKITTLLKAGHYTFANACDFVNTYPDCGEPLPSHCT